MIIFVEKLKYNDRQIETLKKRNNIFKILEEDAKYIKKVKESKGYSNVDLDAMLDGRYYYEDQIACLQISNSTKEYLEIYETWDILEVWEFLALKLSLRYEEPPPGLDKDIRAK